MTLNTFITLITLTVSSISSACQCTPNLATENCTCKTTISTYREHLDEIDRQIEATGYTGELFWIETPPFALGEFLIDLIPALEPDYRRLDRAKRKLEDEFFEQLGAIPPWQLAAQVDDGRVVVYGQEPLSCNTGPIGDGVELTWLACVDMEITYVVGKLSAFLKYPMLMNPNQPHKVRYFLLNVDTMGEKPLSPQK